MIEVKGLSEFFDLKDKLVVFFLKNLYSRKNAPSTYLAMPKGRKRTMAEARSIGSEIRKMVSEKIKSRILNKGVRSVEFSLLKFIKLNTSKGVVYYDGKVILVLEHQVKCTSSL